ncbi:PTS system fructose-specific EIIABC component [Halolactibacillus alkaliphilus]|uniref:PTS system fructose-specific EIIABC component n=1 Tax=Halolactibacillus alkaliphilus TaxID=442899 RepID=A0A511X288_9BACI|nr:PTS fructose transporter subunit IIABC [Halolactibacillus alkaliphilus]GEN57067.1 PTS system fructose-specific EIIABC component [Halolactibacillus alkaliphilus]GGN71788.1 PTS system fructose-specific EIIABC component [Halolactibacillus alkaliphilus]SFO87287.1 PTS system D-fructose-specific IIA component (F1P-forming), Frc family (TC 4.A.2.1.4)/PTS system D-fructose-specific IIB component (F1P-forming), Frc family (TC 4.A.2.1.4)/PTS system D-fructose-specific IIC component (F1P-forming), Frc f
MRITELLTKDTMSLNLSASSKDGVIDELVSVLESARKINDPAQFKADILTRESHTSTGIGDGIAIPHAKSTAVVTPAIAFGRSKNGIDYDALDGKDSHLFFMIAAPVGANNEHLDTLARLSSMLMDDSFRKGLLEATSTDDVVQLIDRKEAEREEGETTMTQSSKKVLAVTGCPTGIAHTYMAADALKAKARELGVDIKVETRGSGGAKDVLTEAEIREADAIIIAADTNVDKERFSGKVLIEAGVTDGIRRPEQLINSALASDAPIYRGSGERSTQKVGKQKNAFYRHLMNGVSHMLPFVVGGGILIALGFMFGIEAHVEGHETYNQFAQALNTIGGGNAFGLMIPVLAGFIAMSIADRPGLAPGMVGGFMAAQGTSGFLGGLIAGFMAGYIVVLLKKLFANIPQSLDGIKTILIYPLLGIFTTGIIMFYVVEKPVGAFNTALGDWLQSLGTGNAILLGLILGGMMAVDMGGPINKAAYTFGIAMIAEGFLTPHAAIMAGGMVPPLGIALATFVFKNRFTKEERDAGVSNIIMGASFITEGAIPFAAADPGRVIPSLIVGSSVAGALSMFFKIGLPAPHGGIFVIPLVEGSALMYIVSILIGSVITAIMLGMLKKPIRS